MITERAEAPSCAADAAPGLLAEFQQFREASRRLEQAYGELQQETRRVDRELAEANRRLAETLSEREEILASMPFGVFRMRGGLCEPINAEARRLVERFGAAPVEALLDEPGGPTALVDDEGRAVHLQVTATTLCGGARLGFVEDRTELDALSDELTRLARLSSLSELALGVAHEIRNPLNAIAGFAGMLRRDPAAPKARRWAEAIAEGAGRVERIVRDLLAFARPEDREPSCERRLGAWIDEARAEARGLEVRLDDAALASRVRGAPEALGKVFANLLRNAAQVGATVLCVGAESAGEGRLRLRFTDDGPGVAPELRARLFDPFATARPGGTGLGLAFCVRALEAMDGRIRLEDREGGACFVIELPGRSDG